MLCLAELLGGDITHEGVLTVMAVVTTLTLLVVGACVWFFARWSMREKSRRAREIDTAMEFGDSLK